MRIHWWILLGAASCYGKSPGAVAPGVVPADLRDVERDGEGLVATTLGEYPQRTPDWTRATSILSLLDQVWSRSKTANPTLPPKAVKMVDDAITTVGAAIASMNQESAAGGANQVGLAVPDLFAVFRPDAPIEIVRMDAMFRQVGLDSHFGRLTNVALDVDSLTSDWSKVKASVVARVPTCHRVGGTATVAGDIEQSLANLTAASSMADTATFGKEPRTGALGIDKLEWVFD